MKMDTTSWTYCTLLSVNPGPRLYHPSIQPKESIEHCSSVCALRQTTKLLTYVCPRSLDPFFIVSYNIKLVKNSWANSMMSSV